MGVDYFTKWAEAEIVASIIVVEVHLFIWKNIMTSFAIPYVIVFDNGGQFDTDKLCNYLTQYGCQVRLTTVTLPHTNG